MATRASPVPTARLGRDPASVRRLQPQRREAPMPGPGTILDGLRSIANDGAVMIAFGWLYPHFLEQRSPALYLVAAPMGLIPCPTLSLIIGLTFLAGGFGSRAWMFVLAAAGLFYGVFGAARLGVRIDLVLAAGALSLIILGLRHGLVAALRRRSPAPG